MAAGSQILESMPKISVLVPVFNGEKTLRRAIESVLEGHELPDEVLIVNDGSADGTASIIEELQSFHPIIRCLALPSNGGLRNALNVGLEAASGDYIARLDADDVWHPRHLAAIREALMRKPEAKLFSAPYMLANSTSSIERRPRSHVWLAWDNFIAHSSACYKRRALIERGGYPTDLFEDYGAWIALIDSSSDYEPLAEITVTVFQTPNSLSRIARKRSLAERFGLQIRALRKYAPRMKLPERIFFSALVGISACRVRLA